MENKALELREGVDEVRKWQVEQYNELALELSQIRENVTEEAKARQQQHQVLAGEVRRFERERQSAEEKERERQRAMEILREDITNEGIRREAVDFELRQDLDKEALVREELATASSRAWQKAIAKTNEDWRANLRDDQAARENAQLRLDQARNILFQGGALAAPYPFFYFSTWRETGNHLC